MKLTLLLIAALIASALSQEPQATESAPVSYPVLSGIGISLHIFDGSICIFKVLPDSVAEKSKAMREGDQILSVQNGGEAVIVQGKSVGEVVSLIRGPVGSKVTIEIRPKHQESSINVSLVREAIRLEGVSELNYQGFIGRQVPELDFSQLSDSAKSKLSDYRGKIVVLDFWAAWCGACFQPIDDLQDLARSHAQWKDQVALLAVSIDTDREQAIKIIRDRKWTQTTNVFVDPNILKTIGVQVLPVLIIISQDGTIVTMGGSHAIDVEKEVERLLQGMREPQRRHKR